MKFIYVRSNFIVLSILECKIMEYFKLTFFNLVKGVFVTYHIPNALFCILKWTKLTFERLWIFLLGYFLKSFREIHVKYVIPELDENKNQGWYRFHGQDWRPPWGFSWSLVHLLKKISDWSNMTRDIYSIQSGLLNPFIPQLYSVQCTYLYWLK